MYSRIWTRSGRMALLSTGSVKTVSVCVCVSSCVYFGFLCVFVNILYVRVTVLSQSAEVCVSVFSFCPPVPQSVNEMSAGNEEHSLIEAGFKGERSQ